MMMSNLTDNNDEMSQVAHVLSSLDLRFFLVRIFYPCLLIWGTIGNALCLRVLLSKKFLKNSTCQYLAVLAVIDILFIVMRSSKHVYKLFRATPIFNTSKSVCRILTFFSSALAHIASWILVIVSFDRYLIVTSRYRRHSSSVNRVVCSTSVLIAIVALCNSYYFLILGRTTKLSYPVSATGRWDLLNQTGDMFNTSTTDTSPRNYIEWKTTTVFVCMPSNVYQRFFRTFIPVFDILFVAVIPLLLISLTNIAIIVYTMRKNKQMRQNRKRAHRRHQRLTIMLLSVTLAFIGLTCPSVIFICVNKIIQSKRMKKDEKTDNITSLLGGDGRPSNVALIFEVCEALWYAKHAMNFILYTLSGQDFRREFIKLFTQCFNRRPALFKSSSKQTPARSQRTTDLSLTETPIVTDTSRKTKEKKRTNTSPNLKRTACANSKISA